MNTKKYKTVLFDLDGTLLDTLADLHSSMNRALTSYGFPPHTLDEVRSYVGNGILEYARRAVPAGTDEETLKKVLDAFKKDYKTHCSDETAPYLGVLTMLDELKARGIKTAIVSNKADFGVQLLTEEYFGDRVLVARGEREGIPKKPAPDMVKAVMRELNADPESTLYVGDSDVDFYTAVNAGIDVALVDWGFRDRMLLASLLKTLPDQRRGCIVSTADALLDVIL